MSIKIIAASILALGLAGAPAFAQSNPAPDSMTIDKNHDGNQSNTMHKKKAKVHHSQKTMKSTKGKTAHNVNKQNCASKTGKNSLQTQGGNSNTENAENTCADNNQ